jgi:hypothetical protein
MSNPEPNQQENQSLFNNMNTHWNQQMTALREEHNAQLVALQQSQQLLTQQLAIQAQELQKLRNLDPPNDVPRVRSSFRDPTRTGCNLCLGDYTAARALGKQRLREVLNLKMQWVEENDEEVREN